MSEDIIAILKENVIQGRKSLEDEGIDEDLTGTPGVVELTQSALDNNIPPDIIITQGLTAGMEVVGKKFATKEYFIPDMLASAEAVGAAMDILKPLLEASNVETKGKFAIATVKGDIHDIGKNIVTFLLEANGFEVRDIGIDQPPENFVEAIREFQPQVVGMSGLLTLAFDSMKETVKAIEDTGLREKVRIMIGGAQVTEQVKDYTGADAYGPDALAGVRLVEQWIGGE